MSQVSEGPETSQEHASLYKVREEASETSVKPQGTSVQQGSRESIELPDSIDIGAQDEGSSIAGSMSEEERFRNLRRVVKPNMDPREILPALKANGWKSRKAGGLHSYMYVCSKYAHEKTNVVLERGVENSDYFYDSELAIHSFCREKLGWVGPTCTGKPEAQLGAKRTLVVTSTRRM